MHKFNSIGILEKLISFDTTSCNSNLALINYIANFLNDHDIKSELIFDNKGKKANLFATIAGPEDVAGLVLSGHTDVVPISDQNWTSDPFKLNITDNKLFGRGSSDMKGFIAICMSLTPQIKKAKLKQPVHFAFSYDEEIGCIGVRDLIAQLKNRQLIPKACIVGEPTSMQPIFAHKGKLSQRCHVYGHSCHSSRIDEGLNAVEYGAKIISFLHDLSLRIKDNGPFDKEFIPSYSSVHTGPFHGGTVLNIVPNYCSFDFEIRNIPQQDYQLILNEIKDYASKVLVPQMLKKNTKAKIDWETLSEIPAFSANKDDFFSKLSLSLSTFEQAGKVSFGTEAGLFQQLGMQTIVCGPGNIDQAHKPDEYIEINQMAQCETYLQKIMSL